MMAIVMLLVLASTAFADEYTPNDNIQIIKGGGGKFGIRIGGLTNWACIEATVVIVFDDVEYVISWSKWQMRADEGDSWTDVQGTALAGICILANPTIPGEYRWVADMSVGGVLHYMASGNTLVVAGDPDAEEKESQETDESAAEDAEDETAVETVTWGFLKSRATR